jgi:hypothetical protein
MNINEVFIPEGKFIIPTGGPGGTQPVEFYQGSNLWKRMAKVDVGRYKIGVEKEIYNSRVGKIKNKYGL